MVSTQASRAASAARNDVLTQLIDDHKRVRKAYREFQKLDVEEDAERCEEIVQQVLHELTVHAALEEEFLYPAAREAIEDDLLDEAEVEHESMHSAIDQLREMSPSDDKYAARFTVLCEYVLHHVKEEEGEMFPQLQRAKLDWESLAQEMNDRRASLSEESGSEVDTEDGPNESGPTPRAGSKAKSGRAQAAAQPADEPSAGERE
jgi:hemerythrin superfamily protein